MPDKAYHLARARAHFAAANQATDAAEAATKDPTLKGIAEAATFYAAATGVGNWLWLQLTATSIPDTQGRPEHVLVLVEDVTSVRLSGYHGPFGPKIFLCRTGRGATVRAGTEPTAAGDPGRAVRLLRNAR